MENLVDGTKSIIETQIKENKVGVNGRFFTQCQKSYLWTNENIKQYLELYDIGGKDKALSVTASGDHTFNLISKGILNIDTFDTNNIANYIAFGLKRALILKYNFNEFLLITIKIMNGNISLEELTNLLIDLLPYMDTEYRNFWQKIIDFNYRIQKEKGTNFSLIDLICINVNDFNYLENNNYLSNEENYNLIRSSLGRANITFKNVDAKDLSIAYKDERYDIILLSNILEYFTHHWGAYWDYSKLNEYIQELTKICNIDALIYLTYIFSYGADDFHRSLIINGSHVTKEDFNDEEIHKIPRNNKGAIIYDGVVLKRVK